ncbi:MAG: ATP synthase F1 subunit epsilon [Planctomycetota bacterium]
MAQLQCVIVTPEQTVLDTEAEFVALPLFDGEIGIAPGRGPLIGRLGFGEMRLRRGAEVERYYLDGGFVQVAKNVISILTNRAIPGTKINEEAAKTQIDGAMKKPITTPELLEIRDRSVAQGRAQLRVAKRSK